MLTTPTIVDREAQRYVAVRRAVSMADFGAMAAETSDLVIAFAKAQTGELAPSFIKYNVIDMDGLLDLEFGVPVTGDLEPSGEFFVGELPAGSYATVTHTGSYDELYDVTAMLVGWAKERGVQWDSAPAGAGERFVSRTETYLNDPGEVPQHELVTRLDIKVREASTAA